MQNEQQVLFEENENDPILRTKHIIEYLENLWQRPNEPSAEALKQITEFVVVLPEQQRAIALKVIASHLVSHLSLRYLEIISTFQQKAKQEGIEAIEIEATLSDVLSNDFQQMMELNNNLSIQSLDDLLNLSNAIIGLYRHSQLLSAENAQWWTYRLPTQTFNLLARKQLIRQT